MMGQEHLRNLTMIEGIRVTAIYEPDTRMRSESARLVPKARFTESEEEVIRAEDVDALVIASPNYHHARQLELISSIRPLPILVEKPVCTSLEQLRALQSMEKNYPSPIWVAMEYRYMPPISRLVDEVHSGKTLGKITSLSIRSHRYPFLSKVGDWNRFNENTGGTLVEKCCHFFDLMAWLVDSVPKTVTAVAGQDVVKEIYGIKPDIFDNGWVTIEYENGARGMLGLCMFGAGRKPLSITVLGEDGQMEGLFGPQKIEVAKRGVPQMEVIEAGADNEHAHLSHGGGVYFEHLAFIDSIRTGRTPLTDIETAKWSTLVGLAAEESARNSSTPVSL